MYGMDASIHAGTHTYTCNSLSLFCLFIIHLPTIVEGNKYGNGTFIQKKKKNSIQYKTIQIFLLF